MHIWLIRLLYCYMGLRYPLHACMYGSLCCCPVTWVCITRCMHACTAHYVVVLSHGSALPAACMSHANMTFFLFPPQAQWRLPPLRPRPPRRHQRAYHYRCSTNECVGWSLGTHKQSQRSLGIIFQGREGGEGGEVTEGPGAVMRSAWGLEDMPPAWRLCRGEGAQVDCVRLNC